MEEEARVKTTQPSFTLHKLFYLAEMNENQSETWNGKKNVFAIVKQQHVI